MHVHLHKKSAARHVLEVQRPDGSSSSTELESRSCLRHDLMHYAFERRAGLQRSFYGAVAAGADPALLGKAMAGAPMSGAPPASTDDPMRAPMPAATSAPAASEMHTTEIL